MAVRCGEFSAWNTLPPRPSRRPFSPSRYLPVSMPPPSVNQATMYLWLEGQYDRLPALMADLVRRRVAVIATAGREGVRGSVNQIARTFLWCTCDFLGIVYRH